MDKIINTEGYTPEIVWAMMHENQKLMQENWTQIKELKESQKETDRLFKETDREIKELQKVTELSIQELTKNVHHLNDDIGGMQNSTDFFAEQYFFNCFKKGKRNFFGENFDEIKKNIHGGKPRSEFHDEYDIVL
jgi:hypothetical protein